MDLSRNLAQGLKPLMIFNLLYAAVKGPPFHGRERADPPRSRMQIKRTAAGC